MSICYWSILATSMMAPHPSPFPFPTYQLTLRTGTGLSDGFLPGGIDAHDVYVPPSHLSHRLDRLTAPSPTSSSHNSPMMFSPSESTLLFRKTISCA